MVRVRCVKLFANIFSCINVHSFRNSYSGIQNVCQHWGKYLLLAFMFSLFVIRRVPFKTKIKDSISFEKKKMVSHRVCINISKRWMCTHSINAHISDVAAASEAGTIPNQSAFFYWTIYILLFAIHTLKVNKCTKWTLIEVMVMQSNDKRRWNGFEMKRYFSIVRKSLQSC